MKQKMLWSCNACGHSLSKWVGQCPSCEGWNTFVEGAMAHSAAVRLDSVEQENVQRFPTGLEEFDRLIGGGVVPGSLTLVGGDPGIGKSTLLLQVSQGIAQQGKTVLYVCGEESVAQTSMRAQRLQVTSDKILLLSETNLSLIKQQIEQHKPDLLIIDSIQIVYKEELPSAPGSVVQVREAAAECMHIAKGKGISTFLIGHVTKSGEIAGPRVLEHIVDTVLYFEGEKRNNYRLLRGIKNRFGSTDEVAVFQMTGGGLSEVSNPSEIFLEERLRGASGSVIFPTLEGTRPILIETQALVTASTYSSPSRRCSGFDQNRLVLLLAVLEKRVGYQLHNRDVFVSIAGGLRITEPAVDLAATIAVSSSLSNREVDANTVVLGEVGLGGEVRSVSRIEVRLKEAVMMGFKRAVVPKRDMVKVPNIEVIGVERVEEAIEATLS
ncbi:MAG: DNA repair protein RadA [Chlamydiales bacterium]|nr:DNA repair protein RadA [Chlamydiales bacterium]MCH9635478.1 DNA repair protein RadA [Chlamydiales bacterium]